MSIRLQDIAKKAKVSISTASVVLNNPRGGKQVKPELAARVRDVALELGYIPRNTKPDSKRNSAANIIGFVLDTGYFCGHYAERLAEPYFTSVISGSEVYSFKKGFNFTIFNTTYEEAATQRAIAAYRKGHIDGFITFGESLGIMSLLKSPPTDIPIVAVQAFTETSLPKVNIKVSTGIDETFKHLVELGHRNFLYFGPEEKVDTPLDESRQMHFMRKIMENGLNGSMCNYPKILPPDNLREQKSAHQLVEFHVEQAEEALNNWLDNNAYKDLTAILCYNDATAAGAYRALSRHSLSVPGDISVVGIDNNSACMLNPSLTTIDNRLFNMGYESSKLLFEIINHKNGIKAFLNHQQYVDAELIVRNSTADAK